MFKSSFLNSSNNKSPSLSDLRENLSNKATILQRAASIVHQKAAGWGSLLRVVGDDVFEVQRTKGDNFHVD